MDCIILHVGKVDKCWPVFFQVYHCLPENVGISDDVLKKGMISPQCFMNPMFLILIKPLIVKLSTSFLLLGT